MPGLDYLVCLILLLAGLIAAMVRMGVALEEANIEGFVLWMSVAAVIAFVPATL